MKKKFSIKILIGGLAAGTIIQLNYAFETLEKFGLLGCFEKYWPKIIFSAFLFALTFHLCATIAIFIAEKRKLNIEKKEIENFFFSFIILIGYLFFKPSNNLLISLFLLIPFLFYYILHIRPTIDKQYLKNLSILYVLILIFQISKDIIQLKYSPSQNYLFYTSEFVGLLIYLIVPALITEVTKIYSFVILLIFFVTAFITNTHILTYGKDIPPSAYYAIWETNSIEAFDYMKQYFDFSIVSMSLVLILIVIIPFFIVKKPNDNVPLKIRLIVISIFIALSYLSNNYEESLPNRFYSSYEKYNKELLTVKEQIEFRKNNPLKNQSSITCNKTIDNQTIVLVIGESASKYHQSLYNYQRNTNPLLKSINNELFIFDSVIAPNAHTNPVLSKVLTFANNENMEPLYSKRNIIEYMKAAGYKTFWLSNQAFAENYSTIATSIGLVADWYIFTNHNLDDYQNNDIYLDELLFKPFDVALKDNAKKKFIVVHLMGSHSDKVKRYTKEFAKFTDWSGIPNKPYNRDGVRDLVNAHDNSILYNDWILYSFIQTLKSKNNNSAFIYFSDHGEEIFEYRDFWGHAEGNASIFMLDIPFVVWLSNQYKASNKERIDYISKNLHRKYQTDDMIHSIIDISDCKSSDYDSTRSIFSKYFKFRKRTIEGHDYDEMIRLGKKSITD